MHDILTKWKLQDSSLSERNAEYLVSYQTEVTDFAVNELGFSDAQLELLNEKWIQEEDREALEAFIISKGEAE